MSESSTPISFDELAPKPFELWGLWNDMRGGRPMPKATDIQLPALRHIASRLCIWETRERNPERYRLLVYGSRIILFNGTDVTGWRLGQMPLARAYLQGLQRDYGRVVATGEPAAHRMAMLVDGAEHHYTRVIAPVGQLMVTHLLVCSQAPDSAGVPVSVEMLERIKRRHIAERQIFAQPSILSLMDKL
jgi:hypothetical protein